MPTTKFQPPPTYAMPVIEDQRTGKLIFNPIWLKWFLDLSQNLGVGGAGAGSVTQVIAGAGLAGGTITGVGTVSLAPVGTAGTYDSITTNIYGQVVAGTPYVPGTGVTSIAIATANGFAGNSSGGTAAILTLNITLTGLLRGDGTVMTAATANVDYIAPSAVVTKTADFALAAAENWVINNKGSACVATLPAASAWPGRSVTFQNYQAFTLASASSNVVPQGGGAAGTAILLGVVGNWATLVSDGTNWVIMQAAAYNNLILE